MFATRLLVAAAFGLVATTASAQATSTSSGQATSTSSGQAASTSAGHASWPTKPIRIVVTFTPGGAPDTLARILAEKWAPLGQPVTVDNKPGAGGNIGADFVAKSAPDGHTLVVGTVGTHAINAALYTNMPYHPQRDFTPIIFLASTPNLLVVNNNVPAKTTSGTGRAGEEDAADLRLQRQRHVDPPLRRAVQHHGRREDAAHPLQGPRRRHSRPAGRPHHHDLRQHAVGPAAGEVRRTARDRRDERHALARRAADSHAGRVGPAGLRSHVVVRAVRAGRAAARRAAEDQRRDRARARHAGRQGEARDAGSGSRAGHAGGSSPPRCRARWSSGPRW